MDNNQNQKTLTEIYRGLKVFIYKKNNPNNFHAGIIVDETEHFVILKSDKTNMPVAISKDTIDDIKVAEGRR